MMNTNSKNSDGAQGVTVTGKRVLIVDDNEMASELLGEFLEMSGHVASIAHSGQAALEAARLSPPEVCIVDIVLPDMDGYALASALRQEISAPVKVIALSGLPRNMRRGDDSLFDAWLEKPADLDTLESLLAGL